MKAELYTTGLSRSKSNRHTSLDILLNRLYTISMIEKEFNLKFINNSPHDGEDISETNPFLDAFVAGESKLSLKHVSGPVPEIGKKTTYLLLEMTVIAYDKKTQMVTWSIDVATPPETPR